jgi:hypothetical protein
MPSQQRYQQPEKFIKPVKENYDGHTHLSECTTIADLESFRYQRTHSVIGDFMINYLGLDNE